MEAQVNRLRAALVGADPDKIDTAVQAWSDNAVALDNVEQRLVQGRAGLGDQLGDQARSAAQASLGNAADHSAQRATAMRRGSGALRDAAAAIRRAQAVLLALDTEGAPSEPTRRTDTATMSEINQIRAERIHSNNVTRYNAALADREERARLANEALDEDLGKSATTIRELNPERQTGPGSMGGTAGAAGTPQQARGNPRVSGRRPTGEDPTSETPEVEPVPEGPGLDGPGSEPVGISPVAPASPGDSGELAGPGVTAPIGGAAPGGAASAAPAGPAGASGAPVAAGAGAAAVAAAATRGGGARAAAAPAGAKAAPIGAAARSATSGTLGRGAAAGAAGAGRAGAAGGARAGAAGAGRSGAAGAGRGSGASRSAGSRAGAGGAGSRGGAGRSKAAEAARSAGTRAGGVGAAGARRRSEETDADREHLLAEQDIWIDDDEVAPQVLD